MDLNDALKQLKDSPELAKSLEAAIGKGVDATELRGTLANAGLDADAIEALVAEYQKKRGLAVADDDLDEEMLKMVAGGGCGKCTEAADCDSMFKNSKYWDKERCTAFKYCDQVSEDPQCTSSHKG